MTTNPGTLGEDEVVEMIINEGGGQLGGQEEEVQVGIKYWRSNTVKVKWDKRMDVHYDSNILENIFVKYGTVTGIVINDKKCGSALIEFASPVAARLASKETGFTGSKIKVKTLWKADCDGDGGGVGEHAGSPRGVGSPMHACPACSKIYAQRQHLKRHVKLAHGCTLEDLLKKNTI